MAGNALIKSNNIIKEVQQCKLKRQNSFYDNNEKCFRWSLLAMLVAYTTILGLLLTSTSVFYAQYTFMYPQHTKAEIGWIVSIHVAVAYAGGMIVSAPLKVYGCRPVAFVGAIILVSGLVLSVFMTSIYTLYITQGFLTGLGHCMNENAAFVMMQLHYPDKYRTLATGIGMLGFNIGNFVGPVLTQGLVDLYGLRGGLLIFSAIVAHLLPISLLFRPAKKKGDVEGGCSKSNPIEDIKDMAKDLCNFSSLRNPSFVLFSIGAGFLYRFVHFGFIQHFSKRAIHGGLSAQSAAILLSIGFICSTVTRLLTAFIGNLPCVDRKAYFSFGALISTIGVSCYFLLPGLPGIAAASVLEGSSVGLSNTIFPVILVELQGVDNFPRSIGIYHFLVGSSALVATPVMGLVYDKTENYDYPFVMCVCLVAVSTVLTFVVYLMEKRKRKDRGCIFSGAVSKKDHVDT